MILEEPEEGRCPWRRTRRDDGKTIKTQEGLHYHKVSRTRRRNAIEYPWAATAVDLTADKKYND